MTAEVDFYFDVTCPWAALAAARMDPFVGDASVRWHPLVLGDLRAVVGTVGRMEPPARLAVCDADLQRWASFWSTPVREVAATGRHAARVLWCCPPARRPELARAIMRDVHQNGRDPDDRMWIDALARSSGVDGVDGVDEVEADAGLRRVAQEAAATGVFGAPSWATPQGVVYGQDRMWMLAAMRGEQIDPTRWAADRGGPAPLASVGEVELEFFHDFASPFSYLASIAVQRVAHRHTVSVTWSPILLGGLFREIGTPEVPLFTMTAAEQDWMKRDLVAWAEALDAPFRFPEHFPMRSILPLRASLVEPHLRHAIYRAAWGDNRRVDAPESLTEIVVEQGLDPQRIANGVADPEIKAQLRDNTDRACEIGACGVPTFVVRRPGWEPIVLWGQDRLVHLDAVLAGGWWPPPGG